MKSSTLVRALAFLTALLLLPAGIAVGAGEKTIVYGADTTPVQRQALGQIFGANASDHVDTVSTAEMVAALQGSGLSVAPADQSISSTALTCLNSGAGLTVQTQNITRITAPVYANALVTAGAVDASVLIAAPPDDPVTGETALVGVVKALPQCQAGKPLDAGRVSTAYKEVAWTIALAGPAGDINRAAALMQQAAQPVIAGQARDEASIGSELDAAATAQGLPVNPALRPSLIAFLRGLGGLNYGPYAQGYRLQQTSPSNVTVLPAGATAGAVPPAGATFVGRVQKVGPPLVVRSSGQSIPVQPAANAAVTRNGEGTRLGDLHAGDIVTVDIDANGSAARIAATGPAVTDWSRRLWALLPDVLLLALLLWLLSRRPHAERRTLTNRGRPAPAFVSPNANGSHAREDGTVAAMSRGERGGAG